MPDQARQVAPTSRQTYWFGWVFAAVSLYGSNTPASPPFGLEWAWYSHRILSLFVATASVCVVPWGWYALVVAIPLNVLKDIHLRFDLRTSPGALSNITFVIFQSLSFAYFYRRRAMFGAKGRFLFLEKWCPIIVGPDEYAAERPGIGRAIRTILDRRRGVATETRVTLLKNNRIFVAAWTVVVGLGVFLDSRITPWAYVFGFTFVIGAIPQWLLLRRRIPAAGWWLLATPLGGLIASGLSVFLGLMTSTIVAHSELALDLKWAIGVTGSILSGSLQGALVGIGQWLVLRRWVPRAGWWIGVSVLAWTLARAVESLRFNEGQTAVLELVVGSWLVSLTMAVVVSGVTAIGLLWLLRQSPQAASDEKPAV